MAEHPTITHVDLYQDAAGEWRFNAVSSNGNVIDREAEGYTNKEDAKGAIRGSFGDDIRIEEVSVEEQPPQNDEQPVDPQPAEDGQDDEQPVDDDPDQGQGADA